MKKTKSVLNEKFKYFLKYSIITLIFLSDASFAQSENIKILVISPVAGASSGMGLGIREGASLAAAEINKAGGVLGKQLEIVERDDQSKPAVGFEIAKQAVSEKIVAVVGFANSGVALAANPTFQTNKIPVIVTLATATIITHADETKSENYIFRISAHDSIQAPMIVEEAIVKNGFKSPAILADSTNYGQGGRIDLEQSLSFKRISPVSTGVFKVGDTDMTDQLKKARDAGADVIFGYAQGPELAVIVNTAAKMGWKVPLYAAVTMATSNFIDAALANGDGNKAPQTFIQNPNSQKRKAFIDSYIAAYKPANGRMSSPVSAAQSYDAVYLLAEAMGQAKSTDGQKIQHALESLENPVEGVVTIYNKPFNKTDHEAITSNMLVFGEVKNGRVVFSNPKDANTVNRLKVSNDKFNLYKR